MRDRRRLPRAPIDMPLEEELMAGRQKGRALNICELGMRYVTSMPAGPEDDEVFLRFSLPGDDHEFEVLGCVAEEQSNGDVMCRSVTFAFMSDDDEARLRHFVNSKRAP